MPAAQACTRVVPVQMLAVMQEVERSAAGWGRTESPMAVQLFWLVQVPDVRRAEEPSQFCIAAVRPGLVQECVR